LIAGSTTFSASIVPSATKWISMNSERLCSPPLFYLTTLSIQHWWNDTNRGQSNARRDTTSLSLCLPQIRHELAWDWTPASTVRCPSLSSRRSLVFCHGWPHTKFVVDVTALEQDFSLVSSASSRSLYSATDPYSSIVTPDVGDSTDEAASYRVCLSY
jgi:hypothetical protein